MAATATERINWHALGLGLRAIDFHFLWMITAKQSEASLWRVVGDDGPIITFIGFETREQFALAAGYLEPRHMFRPMRKCDEAYVESQRRKVGTIFANLIKKGFLLRTSKHGVVETTLILPTIEGAK